MSGDAGMGGWWGMGLDDDFPIRQALPAGLFRLGFSPWLIQFCIAKNDYSSIYNTFK